MFVITNRNLKHKKEGPARLGKKINVKGPNELRVVEATRGDEGWQVDILDDKKTIVVNGRNRRVDASEYVAKKVLDQIAESKRHLLLFVHGFNNDMEDVLERAHSFETNYNILPIVFSWPANGGGARGAASYLSDKRDAKVSVGALYRVIKKLGDYLNQYRETQVADFQKEAAALFPENPERRAEHFATCIEEFCPFTVNILIHSMGNYLYKHLLLSTTYADANFHFDNVVLASADTNNFEHKIWVDRIPFRNRLYVTINERDFALKASRVKFGEQQKARLGHYPFDLNAENATYIDFTRANHVNKSHAYFGGDALDNPRVKDFFSKALTGKIAEQDDDYNPARNLFKLRD